MKNLLSALFLLTFFLCIPQKTFAKDFSTSSTFTYTVNENGVTHVHAKIGITNQSSILFASHYSLHVGFSDIENLSATDPSGPLTPKLVKNASEKTIDVPLTTKVVGIHNTLFFDVSFDTKDVTTKEKGVWEINIPGLSNKNDFTAFDTVVVTPASFGEPSYTKPDIGSIQDLRTIHFSKNQIGNGGISIAFGKTQTYSFSLTYHLKNHYFFPTHIDIALPAQTNYQKVLIASLTPKPTSTRIDTDGNWLARYTLQPFEMQTVVALGQVEVSLPVQSRATTTLSSYLEEKPYWPTHDPKITLLAKKLKTPKAIYDFVTGTLHYDFSRVINNGERLGASKTLEHTGNAVCLEFTDLFIAIARAAGIPAREVDGFAYTRNAMQRPLSLVKDVLHAWPEYYDSNKRTWVMIDPTWGNTTGVDYFTVLDFDHIAFAIKGESSIYPIAAGGYKLSDTTQKDIAITFPNATILENKSLSFWVNAPRNVYAGLPAHTTVTVTNSGNTLVDAQELTVSQTKLFPRTQAVPIPALAPFESVDLPIPINTSVLTNGKNTITLSLHGQTIKETMSMVPIVSNVFFDLIGGGILAVLAFSVSRGRATSRHLHF